MSAHPVDSSAARVRAVTWEYGLFVALDGLIAEGWTDERILALVNEVRRQLRDHNEGA